MRSTSATPAQVKRAKDVLKQEEKDKQKRLKEKSKEQIKAIKEKKKLVLQKIAALNKSFFKKQSDISSELAKVSESRLELESRESELKELLDTIVTQQKDDPKKAKLLEQLADFNSKLSDLGVVSEPEETQDA